MKLVKKLFRWALALAELWSGLLEIKYAFLGSLTISGLLSFIAVLGPLKYFDPVKPSWASSALKYGTVGIIFLVVMIVSLVVIAAGRGQTLKRYRTAEPHFQSQAKSNAKTDAELFSTFTDLLDKLELIIFKRGRYSVPGRAYKLLVQQEIPREVEFTLNAARRMSRSNIQANINSARNLLDDYLGRGCTVALYLPLPGAQQLLACDDRGDDSWANEYPSLQNCPFAREASFKRTILQTNSVPDSFQGTPVDQSLRDCKGLMVVPIQGFNDDFGFSKEILGLLYIKNRVGNIESDVLKSYGQELSARLAVMVYRINRLRELLEASTLRYGVLNA